MAIETKGSLENILNSYNANEWAQSVKFDPVKELQFKDTPPPGITYETNQLSFGELLSKALSEVNGLQKHANEAIEKLAVGESKDIAATMLAVEKAEIAFRSMNRITTMSRLKKRSTAKRMTNSSLRLSAPCPMMFKTPIWVMGRRLKPATWP